MTCGEDFVTSSCGRLISAKLRKVTRHDRAVYKNWRRIGRSVWKYHTLCFLGSEKCSTFMCRSLLITGEAPACRHILATSMCLGYGIYLLQHTPGLLALPTTSHSY